MFIYFGLPFFKTISHGFFYKSDAKLAGYYNAQVWLRESRVRRCTILLNTVQAEMESGLCFKMCACVLCVCILVLVRYTITEHSQRTRRGIEMCELMGSALKLRRKTCRTVIFFFSQGYYNRDVNKV